MTVSVSGDFLGMQSSADALALIRRRVGLNEDSHVQDALKIDIEHVVHINLAPASPDHLILSAELHDFNDAINESVMRSLLKANAFGESTGPARLSIEANNRPKLSMELQVAHHDESTLVDSVIEFMNHAAYWQSIGTDLLAAAASGRKQEHEPMNEWDDVMLVRI